MRGGQTLYLQYQRFRLGTSSDGSPPTAEHLAPPTTRATTRMVGSILHAAPPPPTRRETGNPKTAEYPRRRLTSALIPLRAENLQPS